MSITRHPLVHGFPNRGYEKPIAGAAPHCIVKSGAQNRGTSGAQQTF